MGKPWDRKSGRSKATRKIQRHLIVCEDEKSAADYLRAFKMPGEFAEVVVEGGAGNSATVVGVALEMRRKAAESKNPYSHVWCVFDRDPVAGTEVRQDEAIARNFHRAFDLARPHHDVHIIWANECFELWYLLHFVYRDTPIGRKQIYAELAKPNRLGKEYKKGDKTIFEALKDKLPKAMTHAKTLYNSYCGQLKPADDNPSTNIHELISVLQKLGQLGANAS